MTSSEVVKTKQQNIATRHKNISPTQFCKLMWKVWQQTKIKEISYSLLFLYKREKSKPDLVSNKPITHDRPRTEK